MVVFGLQELRAFGLQPVNCPILSHSANVDNTSVTYKGSEVMWRKEWSDLSTPLSISMISLVVPFDAAQSFTTAVDANIARAYVHH